MVNDEFVGSSFMPVLTVQLGKVRMHFTDTASGKFSQFSLRTVPMFVCVCVLLLLLVVVVVVWVGGWVCCVCLVCVGVSCVCVCGCLSVCLCYFFMFVFVLFVCLLFISGWAKA